MAETTGDPLNPVVFKMVVGQEALDHALQSAGLVASDLHRRLVIDRMKANTWRFVEQSTQEITHNIFTFN